MGKENVARIYYKEGYKYQLIEVYVHRVNIIPVDTISNDWYYLDTEGLLIIKRAYAWDGSSGPAIDTLNTMRASLVHDVLVQMVQQGELGKKWKRDIDLEYYKICREDGVWLPRALWQLVAIQFHDWTKTQKKVYEAP